MFSFDSAKCFTNHAAHYSTWVMTMHGRNVNKLLFETLLVEEVALKFHWKPHKWNHSFSNTWNYSYTCIDFAIRETTCVLVLCSDCGFSVQRFSLEIKSEMFRINNHKWTNNFTILNKFLNCLQLPKSINSTLPQTIWLMKLSKLLNALKSVDYYFNYVCCCDKIKCSD